MASRSAIQGDMGGNFISLGGISIGHCEKKKVCVVMCLILNCYRDKAVRIFRSDSLRFLFVGLDTDRSLQKESRYTR